TAAPAKVTFAVAPWGEIHIDGKMHGVSPPLQELELPPGKHRIEVRNSGARPHVVEVEAKPGERIRIKHKFN
ncbi:MAG: PEGA domain-containing protein, partial [Burkholderiales bacterium]